MTTTTHRNSSGRHTSPWRSVRHCWLALILIAPVTPSISAQQAEMKVSIPASPWVPTPERCAAFRREVNEAQAALWEHLDACYRGSSHTIEEVSPIRGCYEYATRKCRGMALKVCELRKQMEADVENCNVRAELWRLRQESTVSSSREKQADNIADRGLKTPDYMEYYRAGKGAVDAVKNGRPLSIGGLSAAGVISDQATEAAKQTVRDLNRNGAADLDTELSEFECAASKVSCKKPPSNGGGSADPRTCAVLGTCDQ